MTADPESDSDSEADPESKPDSDRDSTAGASGEYPSPCHDPKIVADLVARDRRTSGTALRAEGSGRSSTYREFITTSYKAGNVLRYLGVRAGEEVLIVPATRPETALAFFGAAQLGAVVRFADEIDGEPPRVVVAPAEREAEVDLPPGYRLIVYGDRPEAATTTHWETEVWSENPAVHPVEVDPSDPLLVDGARVPTHADALSVAVEFAENAGLGPGVEHVVRGSLADVDTVVSGLLAPILASGVIVFPE